LTTLSANTTIFESTGLSQVTKYFFRVRAFNDQLVSPYSPVFSAATNGDPTIPVACSNPTPADSGTYGAANALKLSWSNAMTPYGGTLYYFVYL
jgi:hypothetical protein